MMLWFTLGTQCWGSFCTTASWTGLQSSEAPGLTQASTVRAQTAFTQGNKRKVDFLEAEKQNSKKEIEEQEEKKGRKGNFHWTCLYISIGEKIVQEIAHISYVKKKK